MSQKKVLAVTGIRSEYDILYPIIKALNESPDFEVSVVASSAHLSTLHNFTLDKIKSDGFRIADCIDSLFMTNRNVQRSKGVGILTYGLTQTVEREKPDFLLVVGDREESIATSLVGNYMNILVAHLGGGDPVFGNADDPIRMAVSKLSHIHLVTAQEYANNLIGLKEDAFRIFNVGNPAFANIENTEKKSLEELSEYMNFDITDGKYIVLVKHPLSSEEGEAYFQMKTTLTALENFCNKHNYKVVASYPNSDPGAFDIIQAISEFEDKEFIKFNHTLPREYFVNLMRNTKALIGNSSMGILEAPYYKLPVINVGNRQKGRLNAGNVVFVPYEVDQIVNQIETSCFDQEFINYVRNLVCPFGTAEAPNKIVDALKSIEPKDPKWLIKSNLC